MLGKCFIFELYHEPTGLKLSNIVLNSNSELWTKNEENGFFLCFHVDHECPSIINYINVCLAIIKVFNHLTTWLFSGDDRSYIEHI